MALYKGKYATDVTIDTRTPVQRDKRRHVLPAQFVYVDKTIYLFFYLESSTKSNPIDNVYSDSAIRASESCFRVVGEQSYPQMILHGRNPVVEGKYDLV